MIQRKRQQLETSEGVIRTAGEEKVLNGGPSLQAQLEKKGKPESSPLAMKGIKVGGRRGAD